MSRRIWATMGGDNQRLQTENAFLRQVSAYFARGPKRDANWSVTTRRVVLCVGPGPPLVSPKAVTEAGTGSASHCASGKPSSAGRSMHEL